MSQSLVKEFRAPPDIYVAASNASVTYSSQENELPATDPNGTIPFSHITEPLCQWILYWNLDNTRVRVWDVMVLAPNALFMIFLLVRLKPNISNLRASTSPMFTAFYSLVCVVSFISILRCIMSMTINASQEAGNIADRMMWLILRFFLLSTEASVITFGFYFGYLDSRTSIQRVLICTSFFALGYSAVQGTLELKYDHTAFSMSHGDNSTDSFDVFAHGGMIFLSASSFAFCLVYFIILILPLTRIKEKIVLPSKPSFYYYVCVLAVLNLVQAVGSLLVYQRVEHALCVVDTTTYVYFTLFDPLVYATFLWKFFRNRSSGSLLFSYSHQEEDIQRDAHLSLPSHGPSFAVKRDDGGMAIATVDRQTRFSASVAITPPTRLPTPFLSINDEWHHDTN